MRMMTAVLTLAFALTAFGCQTTHTHTALQAEVAGLRADTQAARAAAEAASAEARSARAAADEAASRAASAEAAALSASERADRVFSQSLRK